MHSDKAVRLHTSFGGLDLISRSLRRRKSENESFVFLTSFYAIKFKVCFSDCYLYGHDHAHSNLSNISVYYSRGFNWCISGFGEKLIRVGVLSDVVQDQSLV